MVNSLGPQMLEHNTIFLIHQNKNNYFVPWSVVRVNVDPLGSS